MPRTLYTGETVEWMKEDSEGNVVEWSEQEYDKWEAFAQSSARLDRERARALTSIDTHAGTIRAKFITVSPGQELTYQEKAEEAADFVAAGYPADTSAYPFIEAEMAATGKTKEQAADDILAQKSAWIAAGAQIEQHRLGGKNQVAAATTVEDIQTIVTDTIALLDAV